MPEAPRRMGRSRSYGELIDPRLRAPSPVLEQMRNGGGQALRQGPGVADIDSPGRWSLRQRRVQPAGARVEVVRIERDAAGKNITVHCALRAPAAGQPAG